jgi:uncharacterized protein (UPF0332 family)
MIDQNEIIRLKIEKAKSMMAEVDVQIQNRFYITAINRLYYSCYHATKALLLTKNLVPKTHSGVIVLLNQHFVLPGFFSESKSSFLSKLMHERIDDDYGDFLILDFEDVKEFIEPGKEYFDYVLKLIEKTT